MYKEIFALAAVPMVKCSYSYIIIQLLALCQVATYICIIVHVVLHVSVIYTIPVVDCLNSAGLNLFVYCT